MPSDTTFSVVVPHRATEPTSEAILLLKNSSYQVEGFAVSGTRPSRQRNFGVAKATGNIVYFLDNDSQPESKNLDLAADIFKKYPKVVVVGGPSLTPQTDSKNQQIFGYVLGSFFGSFFVRARYKAIGKPRLTTDKELILCNMFVRRETFLDLGGFNEELYPNEENEMMDRMRRAGLQLFYHPQIVVYRSQRPSFVAFIKQLWGYGRGRAEQMRVDFVPANLVMFLFMLFPLYLLSLPLQVCFSPLLLTGIGVYLFVIICASVGALRKGVSFFIKSVFAFFLSHLFYGLGMWRGFFGKLRSGSASKNLSLKKLFSFTKK